MRTDVPLEKGTQRDDDWPSRSPASVAETLGVDPAYGLTAAAAAAADRLRTNGPNPRPEQVVTGDVVVISAGDQVPA